MNLLMSMLTAFGSVFVSNDAQKIWGTWEGDGHQVEITSNGNIIVDSGKYRGRYKAENNTLYIKWRDGSRSTIIWALLKDKLSFVFNGKQYLMIRVK